MKFSIVTITFNSEKTLRDTFESILKQTYRPLQYIVVDGLSSDSTLKIIYEYEPIFEQSGIEFIYSSEKDNGISDAFNKGIRRADGDIIGIINSDDILAEDALITIAQTVEENIDVYYGQCIVFQELNGTKYIVTPKTDLNRLYTSMVLYHPSCFVRLDAYKRFGYFDDNLKYCMDRELLLRFLDSGCRFKYIDKPLAGYREGGVNQKNYARNAKEGAAISIKYGMHPLKANYLRFWKIIKFNVWRIVQGIGAEGLFHKKAK